MDNNLLYVTHIRDELLFLMRMRDSLSYESLLVDDVKQRAIIRSIEVIGEAANNVSKEFALLHPEIPWRKLVDTRNRLIHGYFTVSLSIVWQILVSEVEPLLVQVQSLF